MTELSKMFIQQEMRKADCEKQIYERLRNRMMDSSEILSVDYAVPIIQACEFEFGVTFLVHELMKLYWEVCDGVVDEFIQNERDTTQGSDIRESRIKDWENMRPSTHRRNYLLSQMKK